TILEVHADVPILDRSPCKAGCRDPRIRPDRSHFPRRGIPRADAEARRHIALEVDRGIGVVEADRQVAVRAGVWHRLPVATRRTAVDLDVAVIVLRGSETNPALVIGDETGIAGRRGDHFFQLAVADVHP